MHKPAYRVLRCVGVDMLCFIARTLMFKVRKFFGETGQSKTPLAS